MIESIGNNIDIDLYRDFRSQADSRRETAESTQNTADEQQKVNETQGNDARNTEKATAESDKARESQGPADKNDGELSEEEKQQVQELKEIDRKVRQHEMAHLAAAQGIAVSGASFEYKQGPDGVNYAVGGEVSINASKERDPEATIDKARRIVAAALAPSDPSPQDRSVAAKARSMEAAARAEMAKEQQNDTKDAGQPDTESPFKTQGADSGKATESPAKASEGFDDQPHPGIAIYERNQASAGGGFGGLANSQRSNSFGAFTPSAPMLDLVA